jgi:PAS domain-containing protein
MDQVFDFLIKLFTYTDFSPLWKNGNWSSFHGWLYILSDLLVWAAYFVLPFLILTYLRRQGKKINFNGLYVLFATFILISGATYLADALMFWVPVFRVSALMRLATAIVSWITIYYVIRVLPIACALKSPVELQDEIDKRVRTETELKQLNERLLEAERTAKLGYGSWDIFRKHVELSDMACEIMGLQPGAILSYDKLAAQVHPADLRFIEDSVQKNLRAPVFKQFYFRVLTDRMMVRHILVRGEVIRNAGGQAISVRGTIQDVSEIRAHLQRIELQNKRLKKIAWVQSHRMRSPVATILGLSDLFNFDDPADPMNAELLQSIREQTQRLDEMIHEVDELTREKAGSSA